MNLVLSLSTLALRKVVDGACTAAGVGPAGEAAVAVAAFLSERFTDHSQRLTKALQDANERAWRTLELSLAGESLWERCKAATARAEDKAFARQARAFLDAAALPESSAEPAFRQSCFQELRVARKWADELIQAAEQGAGGLSGSEAQRSRSADPFFLKRTLCRVLSASSQNITRCSPARGTAGKTPAPGRARASAPPCPRGWRALHRSMRRFAASTALGSGASKIR